jgi:hypothetical protein
MSPPVHLLMFQLAVVDFLAFPAHEFSHLIAKDTKLSFLLFLDIRHQFKIYITHIILELTPLQVSYVPDISLIPGRYSHVYH